MAEVVIEALRKGHDRSGFSCGKPELDDFLKRLARQHQDRGFSKTYVAVELGATQILGYVTVSAGSVLIEEADEEVFSRLPRHPMPVLHVGRLATDLRFAGRGIGSLLLAHAADVALAASESLGVYAMELDAMDEEAFAYYLRRGFLPIKSGGMRLYAPLSTIIAAKGGPIA